MSGDPFELLEQEYHIDIKAALVERGIVPTATSNDPQTVRLMVGSVDVTDSFFKEFEGERDGFEVIEAGNPARVALFTSDLDQYHGGYTIYYDGKEWSFRQWSLDFGYEPKLI